MLTQLRSVLVVTTMLIGTIVTIWGLLHMNLLSVSTINWDDLYRYLGLLILVGGTVEGFARWLDIGRLAIGIIAIGFIAILTGAVWPLFVNLLFALSSYVVGLSILSVLNIRKSSVSDLTAFLIGAGLYGTAVGLLAHFPINYPGVYWVALLIPVILGRSLIIKAVRKLEKLKYQAAEYRWLDLSIVLGILVHFSVALMPEVGHDALAMHLFIPGHMLHSHEWGFDVSTYVWAVMPMMGDWLYSLVYILGGETAARLINVGFIFLLSWLLRELVIWAGGNALGARWAVLIFFVTPLTFTESSSLFIESIWTAFIIGGTLLIFRAVSSSSDSKTCLLIAALLFAFALAAKAVSFTIIPVLALILVFYYRAWLNKENFRAIYLSLVLFLSIGSIPYVTAWYITGNPVFPFFNEYFQSSYYPPVNFSASAIFEKGVAWDTIYRITFESDKFLESRPGAAGFQWLLLLLPALVMFITSGNRKGLMLIFVGILAVIFSFQQTAYLRYILPSYVILTAAIGLVLSIVFSGKNYMLQGFVVLLSIITVCLNILFFNSGTYYGHFVYKALLSDAGRVQYLQEKLPIRRSVELVNQLNIDQKPVAIFAAPLMAGLYADALYSSWYNKSFQSLVNKSKNAEEIVDVLLGKGVDYLILDEHRVSPEKRQIIKEVTEEIVDYGAVSVRVISDKYRFNVELLKDTKFTQGSYWRLSVGARLTADGIIVKRTSPATQSVAVSSGQRYRLSIKANCLDKPAKGRLQVNWLDVESKFISTNIRVFECSPESKMYSMDVYAPQDAKKAIVYVTGHTDSAVIMHEVSFRK